MERHKDGGEHLHCVVTAGARVSKQEVIDRMREADMQIRGWRKPPSGTMVECKAGGKGRGRTALKPLEDGERYHINVQFWHTSVGSSARMRARECWPGACAISARAPCPSLQPRAASRSTKEKGRHTGPWPYKNMLKYVLEPTDRKVVDREPLFINCTAETAATEAEVEEGISVRLMEKAGPWCCVKGARACRTRKHADRT